MHTIHTCYVLYAYMSSSVEFHAVNGVLCIYYMHSHDWQPSLSHCSTQVADVNVVEALCALYRGYSQLHVRVCNTYPVALSRSNTIYNDRCHTLCPLQHAYNLL
jgi:hypothetical protein